jgi:altronate hydrolase
VADPPDLLRLDDDDNVAVALRALEPGPAALAGRTVVLVEAIPYGHKVALAPIGAGEAVIKYGEPIGRATAAIAAGAHVHVHNVVGYRLAVT